jgi:hypothetical protein
MRHLGAMDDIVVTADWRDDFTLVRENSDPAASSEVRAGVRSGSLTRLLNGVYVATSDWDGWDSRRRHLAVMHAVVLLRERRLVFSHGSAAVAWGLPLLGDPPAEAHVVANRAGGGRSDDRMVRHCVDVPYETVEIGGLEVTSLARTVVDLARSESFVGGVMVADAALRGIEVPELGKFQVGKESLTLELPGRGARGIARARDVISFADGRSGSPIETWSRVSIARAGLAAPELQHVFRDSFGRMIVDFWWPEFGVVGEEDGNAKYEDPRYRGGRTLEQVLIDEKWREDRIRRLPEVRGFARWGSDIAGSPTRLAARLRLAGVR